MADFCLRMTLVFPFLMFLISHKACGYLLSDKLLAWTLFSTGAKQWFLNDFTHTLSPRLSTDDDTSDHLGEYYYLPSHRVWDRG